MENEEYDTIDLLEVLNAVRQHIAVLILCTLATAIAGFAITHFLITPQYESSALMIVNTRQDTTSTVTSDQINSATKLVSTYSIIIKSDTVLQQVIDDLGRFSGCDSGSGRGWLGQGDFPGILLGRACIPQH